MNGKSLGKNLANLERELIALQTAHEIGLGSVEYYEYILTPPVLNNDGSYVSGTLVEIKQGEKVWPLIQVWGDIYPLCVPQLRKASDNGDKFVIYSLDIWDTPSPRFRVISSSQISYRYASSVQEILSWINYG